MKSVSLTIKDEDGDIILFTKYQELMRLDDVKPGDIMNQKFSMDLSLHYNPDDGMGGCYSMSEFWCQVTDIIRTDHGDINVEAKYLGDKVEDITPCLIVSKIKPKNKKEMMQHIENCWRCKPKGQRQSVKWATHSGVPRSMNPLEKLDIDKSYNIVGFMKCGTTALQEWMNSKGYDVIRHEWYVVDPRGLKTHEKLYSDRIPIIMTRDPVERAWSHIQYFGKMNNSQYPTNIMEFIQDRRQDPTYYDMNPISVSNYQKHIKNWQHLDPIIISLEDLLQENPDFLVLNAQKSKAEMGAYRAIIEHELKEELNN